MRFSVRKKNDAHRSNDPDLRQQSKAKINVRRHRMFPKIIIRYATTAIARKAAICPRFRRPLRAPIRLFTLSVLTCLCACGLRVGAVSTPTPQPTQAPSALLTVVWVEGGNLLLWREDEPTPRILASGGAIQPILAPGGQRVAFTRGAQGAAVSLWSIGIDGRGEQELVAPGDIPAARDGHAEINQVAWLGAATIYFNTRQRYDSGVVNDDNLYRVENDGDPQLILPPGAGGDFAISPDGQWIAVVTTGIYDYQKGSVSFLDPLGARVFQQMTFTAVNAPDEPPFYPPLSWSSDSTNVRVPIPDHDTRRVTLWRVFTERTRLPDNSIPPTARIFGFVDTLPDWSPISGRMIYLRASTQAGVSDLIIADENAENPQTYASGAITDPHWLPSGNSFVY